MHAPCLAGSHGLWVTLDSHCPTLGQHRWSSGHRHPGLISLQQACDGSGGSEVLGWGRPRLLS